MRERMPRITIKPDIAPREFLERLHDFVPQQTIWKVINQEEVNDRFIFLSLCYKGSEPKIPNDLMAQFIYLPKTYKDRIGVEMVAASWIESITYDSYVDTVNLLKPLFLIYNRQHKARVRLSIQSRDNILPKLSPTARKYFDFFTSNANKSALHPLDWNPFYNFIRLCQEQHSKLTPDDLAYLLVHEGFWEQDAHYLADIYDRGRRILSRHVAHLVSYDEGWHAELGNYKKEWMERQRK